MYYEFERSTTQKMISNPTKRIMDKSLIIDAPRPGHVVL